jgi:opine dehydrogenase
VGLCTRNALEWLKLSHDTACTDLYEAVHNQEGYYGIKAPPTLNHSYIFDDVP